MKATFIKILEYELYSGNRTHDTFRYISGVLDQSVDPPTKQPHKLIVFGNAVFCSPLCRARQCISLRSNTKVNYPSELSEIPLSLLKLCPSDEWILSGSSAIRKYFKEAFIKDKLLISRSKLKEETEATLDILFKNSSPVIISHTFRLVIIKAFWETHGEIFRNPEIIHKYIHENERILSFGEKFALNIT